METTYAASLLDKLLGVGLKARGGTTLRLSIEQVKDSVARDIEMLLNAHQAFSTEELAGMPRAAESLLTLGLVDISAMSLASDTDRRRITQAIQDALMTHDKRLTAVAVEVRQVPGASMSLTFSIRAQLVLRADTEPVIFDAVLQPGSQAYEVSTRDRRPAQRAA